MIYIVEILNSSEGRSAEIGAESPNDAINEYASLRGFRTVGDPDVEWDWRLEQGRWVDEADDGIEYFVELVEEY